MKTIILRPYLIILFLSFAGLVFAQKDFDRAFKAFRVPPGKIITLSLEVIPSTGFSWQLVKISDEKVLKFLKKEYFSSKEKLVGAPGQEDWSFQTQEKGKAVVVFEYRRVWEKDVPAQKIEEFNVFVE